jgi:glycosyltransferase involved in cell wall biosynthesis
MAIIDVAIPNYQQGRYLEQCVRSVQAQTLADFRILIIDNASTDNSMEVAERLAAKDGRMSIIRHARNLGHIASFNEGIDWAAAKYFLLLCSDDILAPSAMGRAVAAMENDEEISFCLGDYRILRDGGRLDIPQNRPDGKSWRIYSGAQFIRERCLSPIFYNANFLMVRTKAQKCAGHYRSSLPHSADLNMMLRLARLGSVAETSAMRGYRREHGDNISSKYWSDLLRWLKSIQAAFDEFFEHSGRAFPEAEALRRQVRNTLAGRAYWAGVAKVVQGQPRLARELLGFAVTQSPLCAVVPPVSQLLSNEGVRRIGPMLLKIFARRSPAQV